jgi:hypothetical protein
LGVDVALDKGAELLVAVVEEGSDVSKAALLAVLVETAGGALHVLADEGLVLAIFVGAELARDARAGALQAGLHGPQPPLVVHLAPLRVVLVHRIVEDLLILLSSRTSTYCSMICSKQ